MTVLVAVTGGIGSGKSTFSKEVLKKGLKLHDADKEVSKLYLKPNQAFLKYLKFIGLGESIKNKKINKKIVSNIVFNNHSIKKKLENYIFKIVRISRKKFIDKEKKNNTNIIFVDIPLLFENNLDKDFKIVISIISSRKNRYLRLKKSKGINQQLFKKIINSQTTDIIRKKRSHIVIYNNKGIIEYIDKISKTLERIVP